MLKSFEIIEQALIKIRSGQMIILVDDENRENEGDLVMAAELVTAESIAFMSRMACGLICLPMAGTLIDKLALPMMTQNNKSRYGTAFTVSIEAAQGISTGISAEDRAKTIQVASSNQSGPDDIISPGHIFPLRAESGGVLKRRGQTEGSVDLMILAGLQPAAVICEITNEDGSMSRKADLIDFAKKHQLLTISIQDLVDYRLYHELLIDNISSARLPLGEHGNFTMKLYRGRYEQAEHFALIKEPKIPNQVPLLRIHSECITGDIFGSVRCDCGAQLKKSLELIAQEGGVLIYLRQEGRGLGLKNKLIAYELQDQGYDTVDANLKLGLPVDDRDYSMAYQILKSLGINSVRILTNNPKKLSGLEKYGIHVAERISLVMTTSDNLSYLKTKQDKMGHFLGLESNE